MEPTVESDTPAEVAIEVPVERLPEATVESEATAEVSEEVPTEPLRTSSGAEVVPT